ncbi:hypothetical protein J6W91_01215 [Candidatus Saccharibacteria bacterium]|nr:hypothetical protein [Candidatus Saccharibacteria bacterium]
MKRARNKAVKKQVSDGINYRKLFFELMTVLAIAFVATIVVLKPFIDEKNKDDSPYDKYWYILEKVDAHDYSGPRDLELEKELDQGYEKTVSDEKAYVYAVAAMSYYCNHGLYNTAIDAYNWVNQTNPDDDKMETEAEVRKVLCQRKQDSEK